MRIAVFDITSRRVLRVHAITAAKQLAHHGQVLAPNEAVTDCKQFWLDDSYANAQDELEEKGDKTYAASKSQIVDDGADSTQIAGLGPFTRYEVLLADKLVSSGETSDGFINFSTNLAGIYTIRIDEVEFMKKEVSIECIPAT